MAVEVAEASGTAERTAAKAMLKKVRRRHGLRPKTLAADKGHVGRWKTTLFAKASAAAYNLLRLTKIRLETAQA